VTGSRSQQCPRFSPRLFNLSIQDNEKSSYPNKLVMNLVYEQCPHAAARRAEQGACVPWVAGCICFGVGAGQPHRFTGGWSYSCAILLAHATRERSSAMRNVSAGTVQGRRECGDVRATCRFAPIALTWRGLYARF